VREDGPGWVELAVADVDIEQAQINNRLDEQT